MTFKAFRGDSETTCIHFDYQDERFSIDERHGRLVLSVDNADCHERILHEVQSHMVALMAPGFRE